VKPPVAPWPVNLFTRIAVTIPAELGKYSLLHFDAERWSKVADIKLFGGIKLN